MISFEPGKHREACAERWASDQNRRMYAEAYKEEWFMQQCLLCRYYVPLAGPLGDDFGVCSNEKTAFDGRVRFEHDGCDGFSPPVDGTG